MRRTPQSQNGLLSYTTTLMEIFDKFDKLEAELLKNCHIILLKDYDVVDRLNPQSQIFPHFAFLQSGLPRLLGPILW